MKPVQLETRATTETRELPGQASLRRYLSQKRGTAEVEAFMGRVQAVYHELYAQRPAFDNQQLRVHLENNILLGLALYRALQADGQSQSDAYAETRDYLASTAEQQANRIRAFKRFLPRPFRYPVVRWFIRRQMNTVFPADGWDWTWLEDSPRRMAFDGTRCLYLDTLTAYGAPELTPAFCNTDDVMGKGMEPEVVFERKGTLGRGDDHCDFCFRNTRFSGNLLG